MRTAARTRCARRGFPAGIIGRQGHHAPQPVVVDLHPELDQRRRHHRLLRRRDHNQCPEHPELVTGGPPRRQYRRREELCLGHVKGKGATTKQTAFDWFENTRERGAEAFGPNADNLTSIIANITIPE